MTSALELRYCPVLTHIPERSKMLWYTNGANSLCTSAHVSSDSVEVMPCTPEHQEPVLLVDSRMKNSFVLLGMLGRGKPARVFWHTQYNSSSACGALHSGTNIFYLECSRWNTIKSRQKRCRATRPSTARTAICARAQSFGAKN